jgi:hypothetical protein
VFDSSNILSSDCFGKITGKYAYFDQIQFWVRRPLDRQTRDWLEKQCGQGGLHPEDKPARFDARYRQRLNMFQPNEQALRFLAERHDALINRIEVTIDYILDGAPREDLFDFFHRHQIRRWHGKKQHIRLVEGETRYDASQWSPNKIAMYGQSSSRVTGETNCLHLEWHLNGLKAVRNAGIRCGADLLQFDHREFWKKRLLLCDVDRERLGRLLKNRASGRRSKTVKMMEWKNKSFTYRVNPDARLGEIYVHSYDTTQEVIDALKRHRIRSHLLQQTLIPIPHAVLLPDPARHYSNIPRRKP